MFAILFFNLCVTYLQVSNAEVFTAVASLECLLDSHKKLIDDFQIYVHLQEKKLVIIKGYFELYSRESIRTTKDIPTYLSNPIITFVLIKRLISDLNYLNGVIFRGSEHILRIVMDQENMVYPDINDLIGAAEALGRLQKTYSLDVKDLVNGNLNNIGYSSPMTVSDCYELGQALMIEKNYLKAGRAWMEEAHRKYSLENISHPFTDVDMKQYISNVNNILGVGSDQITEDNDKEDFNNEDGNTLEEDTSEENLPEEVTPKYEFYQDPVDGITEKQYAHYEALCRGDFVLAVEVSSRLTCQYLIKNHAFLKLAPLKVEILHLNPRIFLFHDVLSDSEINNIKEIGKPVLQRAETVDDDSNESTFASYRISKLAWLYDEDSDLVGRISQRVSDMTGLSMTHAEPLQVCNYGIGGHYDPHFDISTKLYKESTDEEERMATTLFYMSNVTQGGATVFPVLGLTVFPKKGAALVWYNLHRSGAGDLSSRHAACPVLQGDKWVFTKWIHQYGQEFIRPCNLKYQLGFSTINPVIKTISQERQTLHLH